LTLQRHVAVLDTSGGIVQESKNKAKLRKCRYCRGEFYPRKTGGKEQYFCCESHRKMFWKSGSLPFDKLVVRFERFVQALVADLRDRIDALEVSQASSLRDTQRELMAIHSRVQALEHRGG
jgi:hypothetical protein